MESTEDELPTIASAVYCCETNGRNCIGYMIVLVALTCFFYMDKLIPDTSNLSVIQRIHYFNYVSSGHFYGAVIHCVTASKYCLN